MIFCFPLEFMTPSCDKTSPYSYETNMQTSILESHFRLSFKNQSNEVNPYIKIYNGNHKQTIKGWYFIK